MKNNENEPQKATLERERKIEQIRSETLIYNRTQQEMSNHGKRKTRKKGNHRMKTNEKEPQKETHEREGN